MLDNMVKNKVMLDIYVQPTQHTQITQTLTTLNSSCPKITSILVNELDIWKNLFNKNKTATKQSALPYNPNLTNLTNLTDIFVNKPKYIFKVERQPHNWFQVYQSTLSLDPYHLHQF